MKILLTALLLFTAELVYAQTGFAIVSDKDGFCNVRRSAIKGNNITDTLHNGHLVYCMGLEGNWISVDYRKNGKDLNGQVYSDRVKNVSDYLYIPQLSKTDNQISFKKDSIQVVVAQQPFSKLKHKLSFNNVYKTQIVKINSKQYWGTDGELPKWEYKSVEVYFAKKKIVLPAITFNDLFEPSLSNTQVYYDVQNDVLYIESMNSDGAGAYEVIWKIEKGVYRERYIAYGF